MFWAADALSRRLPTAVSSRASADRTSCGASELVIGRNSPGRRQQKPDSERGPLLAGRSRRGPLCPSRGRTTRREERQKEEGRRQKEEGGKDDMATRRTRTRM